MISESPIDILLVEDNKDDLDLTLMALAETWPAKRIAIARDGQEALDYLFCHGPYSARNGAEQPRLILLDIKLPKVDGIEVLRRLKLDPKLQTIPVVMLTSSSRKMDLDAAYKAGANSYLVKSVDFVLFTEEVRQLGAYWLSLNLPGKGT